jgi:hypothetical protein
MGSRSPHVPVKSRVLFSPPSVVPHIFSWLLREIVIQRPSKALNRYVYFIFCPHIRHPKQRENASPHVLPRSHLVTETPPIIETVLWLVVM